MRYDVYTRLTEVQKRATKFDLISQSGNIFEGVRNGNFSRATSLSDGDHNNVAPRFGLAWDPFSDGKMSVRAGYGIAFQSGIYNPLANSRWNPPFYSFNLICDVCGRPRENILYGLGGLYEPLIARRPVYGAPFFGPERVIAPPYPPKFNNPDPFF